MLNKANNHIFEKKCNVNEYKMCSKWRLIRTMERGQTEWGIQRVDNEERHEIIWERRRGVEAGKEEKNKEDYKHKWREEK